MKIAHITATFPPHHTGTGNVALHNAMEAAAHGHDVHVYTPSVAGAPATETVHGLTVHRLRPLVRSGNAFFLPTLLHHLRDSDLLHLHMPFYGGAEAVYLLRRATGIPLVVTYHQDVQLDGWRGAVSRAHDGWLGTRLLRSADRLCFTSLDYAQSSRYAPLLPQMAPRVVELPNGVDTERFRPATEPGAADAPMQQLCDRYHLRDKRVVLFVGALDRAHYFKGVDVLMRAIIGLDRPDVALIIVGKGDMLPDYKRKAAGSPARHRIHFAGFVPDAELPAYYRMADVTVLPSTTAGEAFGLVLLESLACATPVIASALPGVRSVVSHETDGFLTDPGDVSALQSHLARVLALSPAAHAAMGAAGRRKVEQRYAWPRIGAQLDKLYRAVWDERTEPTTTEPTTTGSTEWMHTP